MVSETNHVTRIAYKAQCAVRTFDSYRPARRNAHPPVGELEDWTRFEAEIVRLVPQELVQRSAARIPDGSGNICPTRDGRP